MRGLRPLLVANFATVVGGGEVGLRMLYQDLVARNHAPVLAVPGTTPLFGDIPQCAVSPRTDWAAQDIRGLAWECDLIHTFGVHGAVTALLARTQKPVIFHALIPNPDPRDQKVARLCDRILCNSNATASRFTAFAQPHVIYNGVRAPEPVRSAPLARPDRRTIVVVGPTCARKGQMDLLPALDRVLVAKPDVDVLFVGRASGPIGLALTDRAKASAGRIGVVGYAPDIADHLVAMALVLVPSRSEGFSRVAVEALRAGTPVLATRVEGLREALDGLRDPWLPDDRGLWADRILRELDQPTHSRDELTTAGARFSPERYVDGILSHYHDALHRYA
ncbi:MAG TPA: glycosyltransferase family 4 protein [Vicinamibacterales bacterium]|nr:glycosyltransferase family 4 protein [Vicinamibacterales bacterium]